MSIRVALDNGRRNAGTVLLLGALTTFIAGCQTGRQRPALPTWGTAPVRAIWVTRWDFATAADIERVMSNCKASGLNTVMFQVRGAGTALYRSKLEPWAPELGGHDPGFDPLKVACAAAHDRGMFLHAWANVIPGWRGSKPPKDRRQLYHTRPDWFWRDAQGRRQPLGWYCSVNPCYPEVRKYLADVMAEIVGNYDVDGLHLDYIRFPNEKTDAYPASAPVPDYPRDPRTIAMFRDATGKHPDQDPLAWNNWRGAQLTQLVRDIRKRIKGLKPGVKLTAAVKSWPERGMRAHYQDTRRWLAEHLLDGVFPMNYATDAAQYEKNVNYWASLRPQVPVVMGILFDKLSGTQIKHQVSLTPRVGGHFCGFAYNSLFERPPSGEDSSVAAQEIAIRSKRRREIVPYLRRIAAAVERHAAR